MGISDLSVEGHDTSLFFSHAPIIAIPVSAYYERKIVSQLSLPQGIDAAEASRLIELKNQYKAARSFSYLLVLGTVVALLIAGILTAFPGALLILGCAAAMHVNAQNQSKNDQLLEILSEFPVGTIVSFDMFGKYLGIKPNPKIEQPVQRQQLEEEEKMQHHVLNKKTGEWEIQNLSLQEYREKMREKRPVQDEALQPALREAKKIFSQIQMEPGRRSPSQMPIEDRKDKENEDGTPLGIY